MTEEELRKFDKETLVQFISRTQRNDDESMLTCLNALERYVSVNKLLEKSKVLHARMKEIENADSKMPEYIRLLKQSIQVSKKLEKFNQDGL